MGRKFSQSQKEFIWNRDRGICGICGFKVRGNWHADHIWPWALYGETIVKNGQIAHPRCNQWKSTKVDEHIYNNWAWEIWYGYRSRKLEEWRDSYYEEHQDEHDYAVWDSDDYYEDEDYDYSYDYEDDYSYNDNSYSYQSNGGYNLGDDIYRLSEACGKVVKWLNK